MSGGLEADNTLDIFSLESLSGPGVVTCQLTHSFSARAKGDRTQPLIKDLAVVGNGLIIATDTANRCVKVFFEAAQTEGKLLQQRLHHLHGHCQPLRQGRL